MVGLEVQREGTGTAKKIHVLRPLDHLFEGLCRGLHHERASTRLDRLGSGKGSGLRLYRLKLRLLGFRDRGYGFRTQ